MKNTLKTLAWFQIVLGTLAIIGWADDASNGYSLVGGGLFLAAGIVALSYIKEVSREMLRAKRNED